MLKVGTCCALVSRSYYRQYKEKVSQTTIGNNNGREIDGTINVQIAVKMLYLSTRP